MYGRPVFQLKQSYIFYADAILPVIRDPSYIAQSIYLKVQNKFCVGILFTYLRNKCNGKYKHAAKSLMYQYIHTTASCVIVLTSQFWEHFSTAHSHKHFTQHCLLYYMLLSPFVRRVNCYRATIYYLHPLWYIDITYNAYNSLAKESSTQCIRTFDEY